MSRLDNAKSRAVINTTLRSEYGFDMVALLNSIDDKLSGLNTSGRALIEPLGTPMFSHQVTAGETSYTFALSSDCRRISIVPTDGAIRFEISTDEEVEATSVSHYIRSGERLDFAVPEEAFVAVIRVGSTDVNVEISELS